MEGQSGTGVIEEVVLDYLSGVQSMVLQMVMRSKKEVPKVRKFLG